MNRLAEQGMNQQYIEKRKRNMRARGSFSCEPRNFHVFPLDNSDIQKPSVNQRSISFQTIIRLKNLRNVWWWKSSLTEVLILNCVINSKSRQKIILSCFCRWKEIRSCLPSFWSTADWFLKLWLWYFVSHCHHHNHPHLHYHLRHHHCWLNGLRKKPTETATNIVSVSVWLWTLLEGLASLPALKDSSCKVINVKDHGKTESISSMFAF